MVIMLSFNLSKEGVSIVQFDKLGNKNLENDVRVKLLIWYKSLSKDNHLAYWKGHCCKKPLNDKHILFPLEYIGKVNMYSNGRCFDLWWPQCRSQWPRSLQVGRPYRGKQQYTQNSLITCLWRICATTQICQIHNIKYLMAAVILRMMARSNCSYGTKVLESTIIWDIENAVVAKSY